MQIKTKIDIHNRFDIEVRNAETGELRQNAVAFNIVLDAMYTRLVNFDTYHTNIHFGTGTGTLAPTRTTLFTWLGQKTSTNEELIKALPTSSWKKKIVLNPEEFVGSTITEVGIGRSATASHIVTHAMLQDAEGNPISINKTALDVVTIFATVFVTFSTPNANVKFISMPNGNALVNYLIGGASFPTIAFSAGAVPGARSELQSTISLSFEGTLGSTGNVTVANWVKDAPNKKATTPATRFGTTVGNGHVAEMGVSGVFSSVLPIDGIFAGQPYAGVNVGTGNGVLTKFNLPSRNVRQSSIVAKIDGAATEAFSKNLSAFLQCVLAPATMPGNNVFSCAWHTIGSETYLAVGSDVTGATKFTWYKLVDGLLIAQTAPVTMPGDFILSCAWHTIGSDVYLAVGSQTTNATKFTWYKLVDGLLAAQTAPTTMPGNNARSCAWHTVGSDTYLAVGSDVTDTTRFTWYKFVDGLLVAQTAPTTMPGNFVRSCAWHTIGLETYLAVGSSTTDGTRFTWYKLVDGLLAAQTAPTTIPGNNVFSCAWHTIGSETYLATGGLASDSTKFTWYKFNAGTGVLDVQTAPVTMPGDSIFSCAWHTIGSDAYLAVGSFTSGTTKFTWYKLVDGLLIAQTAPVTMPGNNTRSCAWHTIGSETYLATGSGVTDATRFRLYKALNNITEIDFNTPPTGTITSDYTVDGIHKTDQYVVDVSFALQYGEVT